MTGEIVIFNRNTVQPTQTNDTASLLAALDRVAPNALQSVAGNEEETRKVKELLNDLRQASLRGGKAEAVARLAQVYATA